MVTPASATPEAPANTEPAEATPVAEMGYSDAMAAADAEYDAKWAEMEGIVPATPVREGAPQRTPETPAEPAAATPTPTPETPTAETPVAATPTPETPATPTPETPATPTPPETPATPQQPASPDTRDAELYELRQQQQAQRQQQAILQRAEAWRQQRITEGWDEEQALAGAQSLANAALDAASAMSDRRVIQDAALAAGKEHNLSLDQVQDLMGSRNKDDFMAKMNAHTRPPATVDVAQAPEFLAMKGQLDQALAEIETLKKNTVPPGQRFGGIEGTGSPTPSTEGVSARSSEYLDGDALPDDSFFADLDEYFGG